MKLNRLRELNICKEPYEEVLVSNNYTELLNELRITREAVIAHWDDVRGRLGSPRTEQDVLDMEEWWKEYAINYHTQKKKKYFFRNTWLFRKVYLYLSQTAIYAKLRTIFNTQGTPQ